MEVVLATPSSKKLAWLGDPTRMGGSVAFALFLHAGVGVYAYRHPLPPPLRKSAPIAMEVIVRQPKPEPLVPPPPPVSQPTQTAVAQPERAAPWPKQLLPAARPENTSAGSSAISVPVPLNGVENQPKSTGPLVLFPKSLNTVVGAPSAGAPIPKGPDRMLKDERLEEKKEPDFVLLADKDGGYKAETRNFIARIKPDGAVDFENRFPIGFQKGGTFTFDITELAMRGAKQDPFAAEKRRFLEFSDKLRTDLRKRSISERREAALASFSRELRAIWNSGRPAAMRRKELFEKWADCPESKEDVLGKRGRDAVEDFIKTYLPAGSPEAYTDEELAELRRDGPTFNPYK